MSTNHLECGGGPCRNRRASSPFPQIPHTATHGCTRGIGPEKPDNAVMWISVFRHLQDAEEVVPGVKPRYDADYFLRITELKIPTESYLQKMWDAQKNRDPAFRVDNWLDVIATNGAFIEATRKGYVEMVAN